MNYLTLEEIIVLHEIQIERFGGSKGIRDIRLLESAVLRPQTTFGGKDLYPGVFTKASALAQSIIKNHAFVDGNKRTGIFSAITFLRCNGKKAKYNHKKLIELALDIANSKISNDAISSFIAKDD